MPEFRILLIVMKNLLHKPYLRGIILKRKRNFIKLKIADIKNLGCYTGFGPLLTRILRMGCHFLACKQILLKIGMVID